MVRRDVGEEIVSMRTTHAWRIAAGSAVPVLAAAITIFLNGIQVRNGGRFGIEWLAIAVVAWCALLVCLARRPASLPPALVAVVGFGLGVVAITVPPRQSGDLYSYAMYGRILAVHHANPYVVAPAAY